MLRAAAAAKLLQSFPTLCDPIDGSPSGSSVPEILQARTLEWVPMCIHVHIYKCGKVVCIHISMCEIRLLLSLLWQPTPVFLPGESQGWGSLMGCHLWGRTESDTTEAT